MSPADERRDEGLVLRLNADGETLWYWRSTQIGYFFPTPLAVTAAEVTVAHLMDCDPICFGSDGDLCYPGRRRPRTVWFDPDGNLSRAYEWPAEREAEAVALDSQGRLVFFGLAISGGKSFHFASSTRRTAICSTRFWSATTIPSSVGAIGRLLCGSSFKPLNAA